MDKLEQKLIDWLAVVNSESSNRKFTLTNKDDVEFLVRCAKFTNGRVEKAILPKLQQLLETF